LTVLSDRDVWREINKKKGHRLIFDPPLSESQVQTTTIDLRVGYRFVKLSFKKTANYTTPPNIILENLPDYRSIEKDFGQEFIVKPGERFILGPEESALAWTYEKIVIPPHLAARIEGRSTLARIGLTVHNTAPTIHPGFGYSADGKPIGHPVCLELTNLRKDAGFEITPASPRSCISQLIVETLSSLPKELYFNRGQFRPK
jgi:dCTP deaminase